MFLETQGSTIDSLYGLLLLSRAPQDSIDTSALSRLLFFKHHLAPETKFLLSLAPHNNYSHPPYNWKI